MRASPGVPPDQEERERILTGLGTSMLVEAAAGTGKTTSMVGRMVELLKSGACADIRTLAAVTFTRKAAAELRARFQVALEQAVHEASGEESDRLERALAHVEQCFTGTIHSFCARLLRERPVEAGVDIEFEEIDEDADALLRGEAWSEHCARLIADDSDGVVSELSRLGIQLADLEQAFKTFALYPDVKLWPMPAEGGGLEGLEEAAAALGEYIEHMRDVAPNLPEDRGNDTLIPAFRSLPRVVSHYEDLSDPAQLMEVLEQHFNRGVRVIQKVWASAGYTPEDAKAEAARWADFQDQVTRPLVRTWREIRYRPVMRVLFQARELYDLKRSERGQLNFQDLLMKAAELLRDNPHVRRYFSQRFTHLLVDEFQDTDPIQAEVMVLLTSASFDETDWRKCRPRPGSLFVVGDPKQSIYRFRRADIVTYNEVKDLILSPGAEGQSGALVRLSANFRTVRPLVEWINATFQPGDEAAAADGGVRTRFSADESAESPSYVPLEIGRREGSPGELNGAYTLLVGEEAGNRDEATAHEADLIARFIRAAIDDGVKLPRTVEQLEAGDDEAAGPADFMIVTRYRPDLSVYAAALQRYGIPHQVTGGTALNEVSELKLLLLCLNAVARPDDPVALLSALRSEAFGVSDTALYRFKTAGGRFNYNTPVPDELQPGDVEVFTDSFARLQRHHGWLSRLPAVPAIENIVSDLGLMVLASAREGGDVQAGSLGKALELVRSVARNEWSTVKLVAFLGQVVDIEQKYDGVSASSREAPAVRIMNLHKAKGLEAPVVFLANAFGEGVHEVGLFVDRSGEEVQGYMAVRGASRGRAPGPLLAHPEGWDGLAEKESAFTTAEELRLRYVAATRAGSALIVTQRPKSNRWNAWRHFQPMLPGDRFLEDPGERAAPARDIIAISAADASAAVEAVTSRLARAEVPTYAVRPAKELALSTPGQAAAQTSGPEVPEALPVADGEHGVEWGQAVHQLLELAMREPEADLQEVAGALLEENGMNPSHAPAAVETVSSVTASEIWKRAQGSTRSLSEVPFELTLEDTELPTLIRGAIDLIFPEDGGWVLVDFKTDLVSSDAGAAALAERYAPQLALYKQAWERCTGEPVREMGIYFTSFDEYRLL
jgi:ATP-dependent helicase/nuclease subunit A